jgi:hypothetical protein
MHVVMMNLFASFPSSSLSFSLSLPGACWSDYHDDLLPHCPHFTLPPRHAGGCYTSRPTGNTQTPATQVANSASFSGCLVSLPHSLPSFGIRQGSMLIHRPTVALSLHLLCSDTGKLQPSNVGVVPYCSYRTFNRLRMHPALLPNGPTVESRLHLRPTELRLVDRSRMSVWLLRPIRK